MTHVLTLTITRTPVDGRNDDDAATAHLRGFAAYLRECGWDVCSGNVSPGGYVPPRLTGAVDLDAESNDSG